MKDMIGRDEEDYQKISMEHKKPVELAQYFPHYIDEKELAHILLKILDIICSQKNINYLSFTILFQNIRSERLDKLPYKQISPILSSVIFTIKSS